MPDPALSPSAAPTLAHVLLVAGGGALGSVARFLSAGLLPRPWGTLAVNLLGCLAIGVLSGCRLSDRSWAFAAAGVLGGYTTFSAFGLDALLLGADQGRPGGAALYVGASVGLGLLAVLAGRALSLALLGDA